MVGNLSSDSIFIWSKEKPSSSIINFTWGQWFFNFFVGLTVNNMGWVCVLNELYHIVTRRTKVYEFQAGAMKRRIFFPLWQKSGPQCNKAKATWVRPSPKSGFGPFFIRVFLLISCRLVQIMLKDNEIPTQQVGIKGWFRDDGSPPPNAVLFIYIYFQLYPKIN